MVMWMVGKLIDLAPFLNTLTFTFNKNQNDHCSKTSGNGGCVVHAMSLIL